eukprot:Hpha_TRINITY_DN16485_c1_g1::TRINITY_DN16485_c1_g1_i1::g.160403::m.160403
MLSRCSSWSVSGASGAERSTSPSTWTTAAEPARWRAVCPYWLAARGSAPAAMHARTSSGDPRRAAWGRHAANRWGVTASRCILSTSCGWSPSTIPAKSGSRVYGSLCNTSAAACDARCLHREGCGKAQRSPSPEAGMSLNNMRARGSERVPMRWAARASAVACAATCGGISSSCVATARAYSSVARSRSVASGSACSSSASHRGSCRATRRRNQRERTEWHTRRASDAGSNSAAAPKNSRACSLMKASLNSSSHSGSASFAAALSSGIQPSFSTTPPFPSPSCLPTFAPGWSACPAKAASKRQRRSGLSHCARVSVSGFIPDAIFVLFLFGSRFL